MRNEMNRQETCIGRSSNTFTTHREVIHAHGHTGSQKNSRSITTAFYRSLTSFAVGSTWGESPMVSRPRLCSGGRPLVGVQLLALTPSGHPSNRLTRRADPDTHGRTP